ncbi:MAG: threonine/serine dehydratase [Candidatus Neomarinimicrobiota bacterium]
MDVAREVLQAEERIRPHLEPTRLEPAPYLTTARGGQVYCKLENLQPTGSFKVRGVLNKLLSLASDVRARGVMAASTGNHGLALAFALNRLGGSGLVFVPEGSEPSKVEAIERFGMEVRFHGTDCSETEAQAREYAAEHNQTYISPYNDAQVIGGQGTIGLELNRQLESIDTVVVSLGGGGMISGIAGYLKSVLPNVRIIGCSPENSQVMIQSVKAGRILDLPSLPTLSDGTAGGVEAGAITFQLCRDLVDEYITVSETEIKAALRGFLSAHHMLIEGSAALAIAAYQKLPAGLKRGNVVIIICGANIGVQSLKAALE